MNMLLKKIILIVPSLLGISLITFFISVLIPGDPVSALVGDRADDEVINDYREKLGLKHSIPVRYFFYVKMIFKGDLGESYYTGEKVSKELLSKLPNTLILAFTAMVISVFFGIIFGILSAIYADTFIDKLIRFISTSLISLPIFWFAMILIYIFAFYLKIFPVGGMTDSFSFVLPSFTLASRSLGYLVRLTRSTMIEELNSEYVLCVLAKGGKIKNVIYHAFINTLMPIITFIALDFGSYMNGSVLTETIFGWNGIGRFAMNGIFRRDYPVILGSVLFGAFVFIIINLVIDIVYTFLNPKLRRNEIR